MKFPSIPHGTSPATTAALIEAVELLIGRRKNSTIDYGTIGGQAIPEFSLYNLGELIANLGGKNAHYARLGYLQRPVFSYVDADTLKIGPGVYHHMGTTDQFVEWDEDITLDVSVAGTQFYYLYISDDQIRRHGKSVLSADDFTLSLTAPTYKGTAHALMNGLDRCIFGPYVSSGSLARFFHRGGRYVQYGSVRHDRISADMDTAETLALTIPSFTREAYVQASLTTNGQYILYLGPDSPSAVAWMEGIAATKIRSRSITHTADDQTVHMYLSDYTDTNTVSLQTLGWFFPAGM